MDTSSSSIVNELIETLNDGKAGFETAAADVKDPGLRSTFTELSRERDEFASELRGFADDPVSSTTTAQER